MPSPRIYATAGAFRRALEERLKRASLTDQIDPNRLRRQVSFDRLLARLFREEPAPWVLKGGYALELRFKGGSLNDRHRFDRATGRRIRRRRPEPDRTGDAPERRGQIHRRRPDRESNQSPRETSAASRLEWTNGSSPDSTWTRALVTSLCDRWKQSCARIGWDSPASNRRVS